MKFLKSTVIALCLFAITNCATIFYPKAPSIQKAPLACGVDILFGWTIAPLLIDALYGSCHLEGKRK